MKLSIMRMENRKEGLMDANKKVEISVAFKMVSLNILQVV